MIQKIQIKIILELFFYYKKRYESWLNYNSFIKIDLLSVKQLNVRIH